ncbi:MAG: Bax inhibitor-1/YccA family protein [Rhodospirillaceae bacterium]|nr:Bax inhibitor-1/YccA family protein [Rhodospirillaceae bacterium]
MAIQTDRRTMTGAGVESAAIHEGLRTYMLRVYNYMASGLLLSGIVAFAVANTGLIGLFFRVEAGQIAGYTGLGMISMFMPLGLILFMSFAGHNRSAGTMQLLYWLFVGTMGVGLSTILMTYTGVSVARTFVITASAFAGLSLYGYTTKKDLSGMGTFLLMGLIGLVIAMVVNMIWPSGVMGFVIPVIGVLIFAGLTVYDTQRIKSGYFDVQGSSREEHAAVMGAVALYLNFINLFQFLLMFLGNRN